MHCGMLRPCTSKMIRYRAMRMRPMRGHLKLGPIVTQLPSKKPLRFRKRTSRQSRVHLSIVGRLARLLRVMNPTSCPESHRRFSSPLQRKQGAG
jgi:hypothetical protein